MPSKTRQSSISFKCKKHTIQEKKLCSKAFVNKGVDLDSSKEENCRRSPRKRVPCSDKLEALTPSSALATLHIESPIASSLNKAQQVSRSAIELPCREEELEQLSGFLEDCITNSAPGSLYISGHPGTGKTAALNLILEDKKLLGKSQTLFVNCTSVKSSAAIYYQIAEALNLKLKSRSEKAALSAIDSAMKKTSRRKNLVLMVLDEIDQLECKFQTVLYKIFEWPCRPNSRLILIGIANAVDLTDRMLPRLRTLPVQPRLIHFRPYTKQQIVTILQHRLSKSSDLELFAPGAVELISAKVAGQSGDLRKAIDLGRRVLELTKQKIKSAATLKIKAEDEPVRRSPRKLSVQNENISTAETPEKTETATVARASPRRKLLMLNESPDKSCMKSKTPRKTCNSKSDTPKKAETACGVSASPRRKLLLLNDESPDNGCTKPNTPRKFCESLVRSSPRRKLSMSKDSPLNTTPLKEISKDRQRTLLTDVSNLDSPRKTPRKICETVVRSSPRRKLSMSSDSPVKATPMKEIPNNQPYTLITDGPLTDVSNLDSPRKTPRKRLFGLAQDLECSPAKSPRKLSLRQTPLKNSYLASSSLSTRSSPRKGLFSQSSDSDQLEESVPKIVPKTTIQASDVLSVVSQISGSARNRLGAEESALPLHQQLLLCTVLLIVTKSKNKDVTIGKIHEVYSRVCARKGITATHQSGFIFLCRQLEMAGGLHIIGKGPARLSKVSLQWDEVEVGLALKDSSLLDAIMRDTSVLTAKK